MLVGWHCVLDANVMVKLILFVIKFWSSFSKIILYKKETIELYTSITPRTFT